MDPDADAVPYGEFLALARDEGLVALEVQVVQAPSESNGRTAVVQATARSRDNGTFGAVGEASPRSAPDSWHPFLTTLAELRAKARALRDMTGLEHAVQEELAVPYLPTDAAGQDDDEDIPARPQTQRTPGTPTAPRPSPPAAVQPSPPPIRTIGPSARQEPDEDDGFEEDEDDGETDQDAVPVRESMTAREAARNPTSEPHEQVEDGDEDDVPLDFDAIPPDMLSKLIRLAISIAAEEGTEISDAEARRKLDDFFLRAFKHPLSRATRIEGQRVVQRLSGDLARRRMATTDE